MSMTNLLTLTPWPALSAAILLVLLVAALYFARTTAHEAIHAACAAPGAGAAAGLAFGHSGRAGSDGAKSGGAARGGP